MAIIEIHGNIFNSRCQTLVNTINCMGIMGAGIALEYRYRYPMMYQKYQNLCANREITTGKLWLYNKDPNLPWVLNFPTKNDWKKPTKVSYLKQGLEKFVAMYRKCGITSIAFPVLGAGMGKMDTNESLELMYDYLGHCKELERIEIYHFCPDDPDILFLTFQNMLVNKSDEMIAKQLGILTKTVTTIRAAIAEHPFANLSAFANLSGVGEKSLEKIFTAVLQQMQNLPAKAEQLPEQQSLF